MDPATALKPRFEEGEYSCTWLIPNGVSDESPARVPGTLTLEGGRVPTGHGYGPEVPTSVSASGLTSLPQTTYHPALKCELAIGAVATLLNARLRVWLAEALAEEQGERFFQARLRTMVSKGENPGALAGMVKLAYASRYQKTNGLALELRGLAGIAAEADDTATGDVRYDYIYSTVMRIAGGADEVLRNQIADKVRGVTGMNCVVELVPPRTLPRTSSGKLSRAKAKKLYLSGEIQPLDLAA